MLFILDLDEGVTLCNHIWEKEVTSGTMTYVCSSKDGIERGRHIGEINKEANKGAKAKKYKRRRS